MSIQILNPKGMNSGKIISWSTT
uniref:Uncharacterized protein n=1 Tax=Arundo donax TaxID=35708 RepID=A0A0A9B2U9_ARUDO